MRRRAFNPGVPTTWTRETRRATCGPHTTTLKFAIPACAVSPTSGINGHRVAAGFSKWIANQLRDYSQEPNGKHANHIDGISVAFSKAPRRVGECRYPLYVTSMMARDLFDLMHMVYLRRMECNRRELAPSPYLQKNEDPNPGIFWSVVARNIGRDRRRWRRAAISPISDAQGPLTRADGAAVQTPSEDEMEPDLPKVSPSLGPSSGFADSSSTLSENRSDPVRI